MFLVIFDIVWFIWVLLCDCKDVIMFLGMVEDVDRIMCEVVLCLGEWVGFDMLVIVIGVCYVYFGKDVWELDVFGLKMFEDVIMICCWMLLVFECVELIENEVEW